MSSQLQAAQAEYDAAYFGGGSPETLLRLGREVRALEEQDPAVKARRLRTKAADERAAYQRRMDEYGREIGRAQRIADPTIRKLVESAAKAALDEASECLTRALAHEAEAERIETGGFATINDGVSVRIERAA